MISKLIQALIIFSALILLSPSAHAYLPANPLGVGAGGSGPEGPVGPLGLTGSQGIQGNVGVAGATGPTGLTGGAGPTGGAGVAGATGPQGIQGTIGPQGGIGPAGTSTSTPGWSFASDTFFIGTGTVTFDINTTVINNAVSEFHNTVDFYADVNFNSTTTVTFDGTQFFNGESTFASETFFLDIVNIDGTELRIDRSDFRIYIEDPAPPGSPPGPSPPDPILVWWWDSTNEYFEAYTNEHDPGGPYEKTWRFDSLDRFMQFYEDGGSDVGLQLSASGTDFSIWARRDIITDSDVIVGAELRVTSGIFGSSTLDLDGLATFNDNVNIVVDLDVDGVTNLDDTLIVGTATATNIVVTNLATILNLNVTNLLTAHHATITTDLKVSRDLEVVDDISVGDDLIVGGIGDFTGSVSTDDDFISVGGANFQGFWDAFNHGVTIDESLQVTCDSFATLAVCLDFDGLVEADNVDVLTDLNVFNNIKIFNGNLDMQDGDISFAATSTANLNMGGSSGINMFDGNISFAATSTGKIIMRNSDIILQDGNISFEAAATGGINIDGTGSIDVASGDVSLVSGHIELLYGNVTLTNGALSLVGTGTFTMGTGAMTMTSGDLTLVNGGLTLTNGPLDIVGTGTLTMGTGNMIMASGDLTLTDGDLTLTNGEGFKTGGSWASVSDRRLKENVEDMTDSLNKITSLHAVNFDYKQNVKMPLPEGRFAGFIAQEAKVVIPELVIEHNGFLHMKYSSLDPYLVGAIQSQQKQIEALIVIACGDHPENEVCADE